MGEDGVSLHIDRAMAVLRSVAPLSSLNPSKLAQVVARSRLLSFDRDELLIPPGGPPDRVLMVIQGLVLAGVYTPEGFEISMGACTPGTLLGAPGLLDVGRGPEHARAISKGVALRLPFQVLREQAEQSPPFSFALGRLAAREAIGLKELVTEWRFLDVAGRLARRLLALADAFAMPARGVPDGGRMIDLPLRHQDLAVLAGATRESVSKTMARFSSAGWIRTEKGRITLADEDAIRYVGWAEL